MRHLATRAGLALLLASGLLAASSAVFAQANSLTITQAEWVAASNRLVMSGRATTTGTVNLRNAGVNGVSLGSASVSNNAWTRTVSGPNPVPCSISAAKSGSLTIQLPVTNAPANCGPLTAAQTAHNRMAAGGDREYVGPQTCLGCHQDQALKMQGSLHYQQNGPHDFVGNIPATTNAGEGPAGRPVLLPRQPAINSVIAINTYCGTHENSPRFTCAGCHVGNGKYQATPAEFAAMDATTKDKELANIDCLMCHQRAYKRFPDWTINDGKDPVLSATDRFDPLELLNVLIDTNPANIVPQTGEFRLVRQLGQRDFRTGFSGIPKVDPATKDFKFSPAGAAGSVRYDFTRIDAPGAPMSMTSEEAARKAHRTDRTTCLNCHARAAAADGAKRGDLSTANATPTVALDVHMSAQPGGANVTCSNCHNVNSAATNGVGTSAHRIKGRGLDLRANERDANGEPLRFTCDNAGCHTSTPHGNVSNGTQLNRHTTKVACQTCHIPNFGKVVATEMVRNWETPLLSQTACNGRGGWLPEEVKSSDPKLADLVPPQPPVPLRPTYQWFDGKSEVYYLTEKLSKAKGGARDVPTKPVPATEIYPGSHTVAEILKVNAGTPAYVLGAPTAILNDAVAGRIDPTRGTGNASAKIYPMKEHWGKLAMNDLTGEIIPQSTFEYFRSGSWCRSVAIGMGKNPDDCIGQDAILPAGASEIAVHTYQTLNHGVEVQTNALGANNQCNHCHTGSGNAANPKRMQLSGTGGLGYDLREPATNTGLCNNCHGSESWPGFTSGHSEHRNRTVNGRPVTCNSCHINR